MYLWSEGKCCNEHRQMTFDLFPTAYCGGLLLRGVWFIIIHGLVFPHTAVSLYSELSVFHWSDGSLECV